MTVREVLTHQSGIRHYKNDEESTALMRDGANPRVVQAQLGHADLRMLQRYAHVVSADQRSAVKRTTEIFLRRSAANAEVKSFKIN